ncbi:type II secretion system protein [Agaribacterium sp. ZY112]|uniref:type II secretion system protein n=1 Tax=Agaribacterium sp. ZY112 TaxID=3233574 RepID=UPI003525EB9E
MDKRGFTLVELLALMLIVATLAAIALPRFADLSSVAQISSLQNMEAAMNTGTMLVSSKATLEGRVLGFDQVTLDDGNVIHLYGGYPRGHWNLAVKYLINLDDVPYSRNRNQPCERQWCGLGNQRFIPGVGSFSGRGAKVWPKGYRWNEQCGVYFINHENGSPPDIGVSFRDC